MKGRERKRVKLSTFVLVEIYGDGGAVLSQRVRSDHRVRELQVSWAQYLEQQDHNVAIDVQRIQLICDGHALDADERLWTVPGCEQGHLKLQASRKPPGQLDVRKLPEFVTISIMPLDGFTAMNVRTHVTVTVEMLQRVYAGRLGVKFESICMLHNRKTLPMTVEVGQLIEGDEDVLFLEPHVAMTPSFLALEPLGWALPWHFGPR